MIAPPVTAHTGRGSQIGPRPTRQQAKGLRGSRAQPGTAILGEARWLARAVFRLVGGAVSSALH